MTRPEDILSFIPSVHREGYSYVALTGIIAAGLFFLYTPLGWLAVLLTIGVALFFRDPERVPPDGAGLVLSPADGRVCVVDKHPPPDEIGAGVKPRQRIGVFMSLLDAHINRMPAGGEVVSQVYRAGSFHNASSEQAGEGNERQSMRIKSEAGDEIIVVQIAGLVARRIVVWCKKGDRLAAGERFGMIRFGSRGDVYLPDTYEVCVKTGQTMIAGESVIARKKSKSSREKAKA